MTSPSEMQTQETVKSRVLSAIDALNTPFDSNSIAKLIKTKPGQVSQYLTELYQRKRLRRARTSGALNRLKYLYAKTEWDLPGYELIDRRKYYAYRRKQTNAYRSTKSVSQPTRALHAAPQLSIRLASKDLSLSISEARVLHDELGKLFGDLARPS